VKGLCKDGTMTNDITRLLSLEAIIRAIDPIACLTGQLVSTATTSVKKEKREKRKETLQRHRPLSNRLTQGSNVLQR
jgi:hypothetical protein